MPAVHKIEKLVYDVNFSSEDHAYDFQANVNSFIQNELLYIIDEVFDEFDNKKKIISIDKLELELGRIDFVNNENEVKERLRDQLRNILREKIAEIEQNPTENEKILTREKSDYIQLIHFLLKGTLPWNGNYVINNSIESILARALNDNSKDIINWLKMQGRKGNVIKRIVNQFNDPQIIDIIRKTDPVNSQFISDYATDIRSTHKKNPVVVVSDTEFRGLIWDVILAYLFLDRGSRFNKKSFIAYTLRQIAHRQNMDYGKLLKAFSRSIPILLKKQIFNTEFPDIIIELGKEYDSSAGDEDKKINKEEKEKHNWIKELHEILQGKQKKLNALLLENLAEKYPNDLFSLLKHYVSDEQSRKRILEVFSEGQIKLTIQILMPVEKDFILRFADNLDISCEEKRLDHSKSNFKKVKWQIILTSIFEERGSTFNRKEFVKSTIRQIASHYNINQNELILFLYSSLGKINQSSSGTGLLTDVLIELKDELREDDEKRMQPDEEVTLLFNAYELYDELIYYVKYAYHKTNIRSVYKLDRISSLLFELEKKSPELTLRLLNYIKEGDHIKLLVHNTTEDFILDVLAVMLKIFYSSTEDGIVAIIEAVKWHSAKVNAKVEFYSKLFKRVFANKIIDLSKILNEINKSQLEINKHESGLPFDFLIIKTHLLSILKDEKSLAVVHKNYEETWDCIFEYYTNNLPQLIKYLISEIWLFESFIKKTTNKILLRILKNMSVTVFNINFIVYLSECFEFNKQQTNHKLSIRFWLIVFKLVNDTKSGDDKNIVVQILIQILLNTKDTWRREKAVLALKTNMNVFPKADIKSVLNIIEAAEQQMLSDSGIPLEQTKKQMVQHQVLSFLKGEQADNISGIKLIDTLSIFIKENPNKISEILLMYLYNDKIRRFWITHFPDILLMRMLFLISPQDFIGIQRTSDIVWSACLILSKNQNLNLSSKWFYLFETLAKTKRNANTTKFTRSFIIQILSDIPKHTEKAFLTSLCETLNSNIEPSQKELYIETIHEVKKVGKNLKVGAEAEVVEREIESVSFKQTEDILAESGKKEEIIYIRNAGLVLSAPYLPELFKRFGLLENNKFKDRQSAERAIHLLQFMVNENTSSPEFMLLLNKILCGIKTGIPIQRSIKITSKEKETIEQLIGGMIQNWKVIGNTSVNGFRESFLQREGVLKIKNDCWHLQVELRAYDMLIDQIPWSFSTIKYPWMDKVIYVKWR